MVPLDENRWHVVGFYNLEGFFQTIDMASAARLVEYNRPVQDKINALIKLDTIDTIELSTDGSSSVMHLLKIPYRLALHTKDVDIAAVYGRYRLSGKNNNEIFTGEFSLQDLPKKSGFLPETAQFMLNPMFPAQRRLIEGKNIAAYSSSIDIYRIDFKNGAVWQTVQQIPSQEN